MNLTERGRTLINWLFILMFGLGMAVLLFGIVLGSPSMCVTGLVVACLSSLNPLDN